MRIFAVLAAAAFMLSPVLAQEAAMPSDGEVAQILGDRIGRDQANVGIAVAIVEDGETRFVSHGTVSLDDPTSVDQQTLFEAGSISKTFTSLLLAQLSLNGVMDIDAPISTYLPEGTQLPDSEAPITAFTLATHTAGLTGLPQTVIDKALDNPYETASREVLFSWLAKLELARPVGEAFEYSNAGAALLGVAMEEASGVSYSELMRTLIFEPLGMTSSHVQLAGETIDGMATGHDSAREPVSNWRFDAFAPAGALVTNAEDLAKFIAAASGNSETPLKPAFDKMLERPGEISQGQSIAMGWFITDLGQGDIIWHNGGTAGFRSFVGYDKLSGNGVVLLSNMATLTGIDDIGMHLLNPSLPLREQPKLRTEIEIDPTVLSVYEGTYELTSDVAFTITQSDGRLYAQLTGQDQFEIFAEAEHEFFYKVVDAQLSFEIVDGQTVALILHQNGVDQRAEKTD
jgi:D-alanyl-D-alanine-carboxypeptidase/D-alanyl-D-alanine-endopeptidase